jgi:hypothetical protein
LNDYIRQFDDYSVLASNIVQSQIVLVIPPMQEIRRDAEDQEIPACLGELKRLELLYMDSTIQALLAFQSSSNVETLTAAILQSRQYHEQYALELARVLGVTLTPPAPAATAIALPNGLRHAEKVRTVVPAMPMTTIVGILDVCQYPIPSSIMRRN